MLVFGKKIFVPLLQITEILILSQPGLLADHSIILFDAILLAPLEGRVLLVEVCSPLGIKASLLASELCLLVLLLH